MKKTYLLFTVASIGLTMPAIAETTPNATSEAAVEAQSAEKDGAPAIDARAPKAADREVFSTGVAKGRDRLDSAISTSSLKEGEILKLAPQSIGELLRNVPGIRSEAHAGEGHANITIRGLPLASTGAKFVQLQEDGLPVLEFGDIAFATADSFLRADLNLSQVEIIRGGSASTFASNSPGGIINFQSKTGDVEGGAIQLSSGIDFDEKRVDFDYGARISDSLRFHAGGFYRQGEGPRHTGFDAKKGGQFKFNLTKTFTGGHIRLYGKLLDDRTPVYDVQPLAVTGTNSDPKFSNVAGFEAGRDTVLSRYFSSAVTLDANNNVASHNVRDGQHVKYKSIGMEAQFEVAGWTVTDRFRFADISSTFLASTSPQFLTPQALSGILGAGQGATFSYANGPLAGTAIANPAQLNGNGLFVLNPVADNATPNLNNATNDVRLSRVWAVGKDELTTTVGMYNSRQTMDFAWLHTTVVSDVRGDGNFALINVRDRTGRALTQDGYFAYGAPIGPPTGRRKVRVDYAVNAPFASANYRFGGVSVGGSLRYDFGTAKGTRNTAAFATPLITRDINGDGVIAIPEQKVAALPLGRERPVDYDFGYLSYSTGVNVRVAEPFAVFARYSRGGRIPADRLLFTPYINATTGDLINDNIKVDMVTQAEVGAKYRKAGLTLNLTGFWANAEDTNVDNTTGLPFQREYKAIGAEFEGGYRVGNFSINGGATYTHAEISKDATNAAVIGNTPRHQAKIIYQVTPQFTTERFSLGAVFIGTTGSYAQDANLLKVPGYMTTNAFVQVRPTDRLLLSINANNLFDVLAITSISDASIPTSGIVRAQTLTGRTVAATMRFDF